MRDFFRINNQTDERNVIGLIFTLLFVFIAVVCLFSQKSCDNPKVETILYLDTAIVCGCFGLNSLTNILKAKYNGPANKS